MDFHQGQMPRSQDGNQLRPIQNNLEMSMNTASLSGQGKGQKLPPNQQNNFMLDGVSDGQYSAAVGSVQQRKRRLIMHDNLTNSRGTNRINNGGQAQA